MIKKQAANSTGAKLSDKLLSIFTALAITILTFATKIRLASPGLDPSWVYILNTAESFNLKFGRDIYSTYGPLGFLQVPISINHNALIALIIALLLAILEFILLLDVFQRLKGRKGILLKFVEIAFFMVISSYMSFDYQLCYLVLLSVSLAWKDSHRRRYIIIASALTVFAALVKVNTGIQCAITVGLFIIMKILCEKKSALKYLYLIPAIAGSYFLLFMVYNPSIKCFLQYIRDALGVVSGYNFAMSIIPKPEHMWLAVCCIIAFVIIWLLFLYVSPKNGAYLTLFIGAIFQCFKHGFVRAHVYPFFAGFLEIVSVVILFIDYDDLLGEHNRGKCAKKITALSIVLLMIAPTLGCYVINPSVQSALNNFRLKTESIKQSYFTGHEQWYAVSTKDDLPEKILDRIEDKSVVVLPYELSIDVYNDINMAVMPATQLYTAYTDYLDLRNAEFFSGEKAPDYILYAHYEVDGRIPLLEAPATWNCIYQNYEAELIEGQWLLLKKKETPEPINLGKVRKEVIKKTDQYFVPKTDNGVFIRIDSSLTFLGNIRSFLYQIPKVEMTVRFDDGSELTGRVLPDVLKNGFIVDDIPHSLLSVGLTINGLPDGKRVESIQFGGPGWEFYKDNIEIYLQEVTNPRNMVGADLREALRLPQVSNPTEGKTKSQIEQLLCVDCLNDTLGVNPITEVYQKVGLQINGWAIDQILLRDADAVFVKLGETFYECKKTNREDASLAVLGNSAFPMIGFEGWIKLDEYPPGEYPLSIIMIVNNGTEYYEVNISTISIK